MKAQDVLNTMKETVANGGELNFALRHKRTNDYLANYDTKNYAGVFAFSNAGIYGIYGNFLETSFNFESNQIDNRSQNDETILEVLEAILVDWELEEDIKHSKQEYMFKPCITRYEPQYIQDIAQNKRIYISKQGNEVIEFTIDGCIWNMKLEKFNGEKIRYKLDKAVVEYL